ncbi:protein kinase family protein [Opitutaceae bacterium TAV1]|nr:protein kinase family protein [Opitutaceae bacterium TAV1]
MSSPDSLSSFIPGPGQVMDGYRLVRMIGSGGFGHVWLCTSMALGQAFALKIVKVPEGKHAQRELAAVQRFKQLLSGSRASGLMPIEHVGMVDGFLFYVMPLADGTDDSDPESPGWKPLTLGTLVCQQRLTGSWYSSAQVKAWMQPVLEAARTISEAGLVHRDIKPDNILFVGGRTVLSDISLLGHDGEALTEIGTPGYRAPSWYMETGGHPDQYGLAATLFTLLTGHAPDKMGRVAFRWPPQGEASLSREEHAEWLRLHDVIFRATHERAGERYRTLAALADAVIGANSERTKVGEGTLNRGVVTEPDVSRVRMRFRARPRTVLAFLCVILAIAGGALYLNSVKPDRGSGWGSLWRKLDGNSAWKEFDRKLDEAKVALEERKKQWNELKDTFAKEMDELRGKPTFQDISGTMPRISALIKKATEFIRDEAVRSRDQYRQLRDALTQAADVSEAVDGTDEREKAYALFQTQTVDFESDLKSVTANWRKWVEEIVAKAGKQEIPDHSAW